MKQIWLPWTDWECYAWGMFDGTTHLSPDEAKAAYASFLRDTPRFELALERVITEWPKSCLHFLSNEKINRIAWLGQASMCIATGVNSTHKAGFRLMSEDEQSKANATAAVWLERWIDAQESGGIRQDVEDTRLPGGHSRRSASVFDDAWPGSFVQGDLFCDIEQRSFDGSSRIHCI